MKVCMDTLTVTIRAHDDAPVRSHSFRKRAYEVDIIILGLQMGKLRPMETE